MLALWWPGTKLLDSDGDLVRTMKQVDDFHDCDYHVPKDLEVMDDETGKWCPAFVYAGLVAMLLSFHGHCSG